MLGFGKRKMSQDGPLPADLANAFIESFNQGVSGWTASVVRVFEAQLTARMARGDDVPEMMAYRALIEFEPEVDASMRKLIDAFIAAHAHLHDRAKAAGAEKAYSDFGAARFAKVRESVGERLRTMCHDAVRAARIALQDRQERELLRRYRAA